MHSLIDIFAYKVYKEKLLSHGDIRKMKYAMTVIWYELLKFILLLVLFFILNKADVFLFSLCLLVPIRIFSGGLHFKNTSVCFIVSLSFFTLAILVIQYLISMTITLAIILTIVSTLIIYSYSPIPSKFRPI